MFALIPFFCFGDDLSEVIKKGVLIQTHRGAIPIVFTTPTNHKSKAIWDITIAGGQAIWSSVGTSKLPSGKNPLYVAIAISQDIQVTGENTIQLKFKPEGMYFPSFYTTLVTINLTTKKNILAQYSIEDLSAISIDSSASGVETDIISVSQEDKIQIQMDNLYNEGSINNGYVKKKNIKSINKKR